MTLLAASLSIVLFFGIIKIEKLAQGGAEFSVTASASSAVLLCAVVALFFEIRFLLFAKRDTYLNKLERVAATRIFEDNNAPIDELIRVREEEIEHIKGSVTKPMEQDKLLNEISIRFNKQMAPYNEVQKITANIIDKVDSFDRARRYCEFILTSVVLACAVACAAFATFQLVRRAFSLIA